MEVFYKGTAGVLLALVLILVVGRQERDLSMVLAIVVCCMCAGAGISLLIPVVDFLLELQEKCELNNDILKNLLRITGIALVTEVSSLLCQDGGNASLGKTLQLLGTAAILQLSVPMMQALLNLIQEILGEL